MSNSQEQSAKMSRKARMAGFFYLLTIFAGMLGAFASSSLYSGAATFIATLCYVVVTVLFYDLFKAVNRNLSLLAAVFSLIGCALGALDSFHLGPSHINNLVFFGVYCLLIGYLIFKSNFLPRALGVLMAIAGLGWLTFLSPQLAHRLTPYTMISGLIGEGSLTLWLLLRGINVQRWKEHETEIDS